MSTRGAKPKPTAMKKAAGTLRKHRENKAEPAYSSEGIEAPEMVKADAMARAEWNRITPELVRVRVATKADIAVLSAYCLTYARWQLAESKLRRDGLIVEAPRTKVPMHNMYRDIGRQSMQDCIKFAAELGITPSARTRVKGEEPARPKPGFGQLLAIK